MGKRILTNKHNLPDTIVEAVKYDTHRVVGTISTTTLIDSPKIRFLKKMCDYEVDVTEMLYALMGTALHHILERANMDTERERAFLLTADTLMTYAESQEKYIGKDNADKYRGAAEWLQRQAEIMWPTSERRYLYEQTLTMPIGHDHILSGTFDLYDKHTLTLQDYKFCSTYQWTYPEARKKWTEQLNIYVYMLWKTRGIKVEKIRVIAFFRDWTEVKLMSNSNYPPRQVMEIPITMMSMEEIEDLIKYHVDRHHQADIGDPMDCTGEERWATSTSYAVMMKHVKNAKGLYDTEAAAQRYIMENKHKLNGLYIQRRNGTSKRCAKYCPVRSYCAQWQAESSRPEREDITEPTILPR